MKEVWKEIEGFKSRYFVSNKGRIKSTYGKGRIMKTHFDGKGRYLFVQLCMDSKYTCILVHRLVAEAFIPKLKEQTQVNHKDGNKTNNKSNNLEWVTPKENMKHAIESGLHEVKHEYNPMAKLTSVDVVKIRRMWGTGKYSQVRLAEIFGVTANHIYRIVRYKRWS